MEYARTRAQKFVEKAILALDGFEANDAKNALIETAMFMADRVV